MARLEQRRERRTECGSRAPSRARPPPAGAPGRRDPRSDARRARTPPSPLRRSRSQPRAPVELSPTSVLRCRRRREATNCSRSTGPCPVPWRSTPGASGASSTCATAASRRRASGFAGIGIWHADLEHVLETRTLVEVKQLLDDNGLEYLELECLLDWFLDPGDDRAGHPTSGASSCSRRPRPRRAPHQGREHLRHAVRAAAAHRSATPSCAPTRHSATTRGWSTSSCRST